MECEFTLPPLRGLTTHARLLSMDLSLENYLDSSMARMHSMIMELSDSSLALPQKIDLDHDWQRDVDT